LKPITSELVPLFQEAFQLMLQCSRITVAQTNSARHIITPLLQSLLERIILLDNQVVIFNQQNVQVTDPCVYLMTREIIMVLWNVLTRKYTETVNQLEMTPPTFILDRRLYCKHHALHGQYVVEIRSMLQIVSLINDCRSKIEYDLLMQIDRFSMRSVLTKQMARTSATQAVIASALLADNDKRSDVDFHVTLQSLLEEGLKLAGALNVSEILTHGNTTDGRAVPIVSISASASEIGANTTSPRRSNSQITINFNKKPTSKVVTQQHQRRSSMPTVLPTPILTSKRDDADLAGSSSSEATDTISASLANVDAKETNAETIAPVIDSKS